MTITLNMLMHRFFLLFPESRETSSYTPSSTHLYGIRILSRTKDVHPEGYLYLCDRSHPILHNGTRENHPLICVVGPEGGGLVSSAAVVLITESEPEIIFNNFWNIYLYFRDWDKELNISTIKNTGIQHLIDISEEVIGNPMTVIDTSMSLLAYTRNTPSADPIFNEIKNCEHVPPHAIQIFKEEHYFNDLRKNDSRYSEMSEKVHYKNVIRTLRVQERIAAHVTMICEHYPCEETTELFENLVTCLRQHIIMNYHYQSTGKLVYENLILDLLDGRCTDEDTVRERLAILDIPFQSKFYLLSLEASQQDQPFQEYLSSNVSNLMPDAKVMTYRSGIVVLIDAEMRFRKEKDILEGRLARISDFLENQNISCGVSDLFFKLPDIKRAYEQAAASIEIAAILKNQDDPGEKIHLYSDYRLYHLLKSGRSAEELISFCSSALLDLQKQDQKNGTDLFNILYTYLTSDRKFTETAKILHMHRNNVLYHIRNIQEKFDINLDLRKTRLELLVSYEILRLCSD